MSMWGGRGKGTLFRTSKGEVTFFQESQRRAIPVLRGQKMLFDRSCSKVQLHEISLRSLGNSSKQTENEKCEIYGRKETFSTEERKLMEEKVSADPVQKRPPTNP